MKILILGAAAGGGFPQWNANHEACKAARAGRARPATQASIAVSADGTNWLLLNASPDLRQQIEANPQLWPKQDLRSSPIKAVLLTNGDVDAVAGLLNLREGTPFDLYAHERVIGVLASNPIFSVIDPQIVPRIALLPEEDRNILGLKIRPFLAPGKIPLYLEDQVEGTLNTMAEDGDTLGLEIVHDGKRMIYLANCARLTESLLTRLEGADMLFMDGTLWCDDEMIQMGVGKKTAARMGHMAMIDTMRDLKGLSIGEKIFIHINNTNPALLENTPERLELERQGWQAARDGMELTL